MTRRLLIPALALAAGLSLAALAPRTGSRPAVAAPADPAAAADSAQVPTDVPSSLPDSLTALLDALGGDSLLVQVSVAELTEAGPRWLYGRMAELRQTPASVTKLATAAVALELWPPEHRFTTRLAWDPAELEFRKRTRQSQVKHLWVEPGGDPTLSRADLRGLFLQVWQAGIDKVEGPVVILPDRFGPARLGPGWMWDDEAAPFAARPSQLTVQGNSLFPVAGSSGWELPGSTLLRVTRGERAAGEEALLERDWQHGRDDFRFLAPPPPPLAPAAPRWRVRPPEPACSVEHPDSLFRSVVHEAALDVFDLRRPPLLGGALALPAAPVWKTHFSPPLAQILDSILTESWNLGAECVFQALPLGREGDTGSNWERAASLVERVLADSLKVGGWRRQVDGSGLSRYNAYAPRQVVELLAASERRHPGLLKALLPGNGQGTLRQQPPRLPKGVGLAAKTGSLRGVTALAGHLERGRGPRLAFCLIVTGHPSMSAGLKARNAAVEALAAWLAAQPETP